MFGFSASSISTFAIQIMQSIQSVEFAKIEHSSDGGLRVVFLDGRKKVGFLKRLGSSVPWSEFAHIALAQYLKEQFPDTLVDRQMHQVFDSKVGEIEKVLVHALCEYKKKYEPVYIEVDDLRRRLVKEFATSDGVLPWGNTAITFGGSESIARNLAVLRDVSYGLTPEAVLPTKLITIPVISDNVSRSVNMRIAMGMQKVFVEHGINCFVNSAQAGLV